MWFHYNDSETNSNIVSVKKTYIKMIISQLCSNQHYSMQVSIFWRASQVLTTAMKLISMENGTGMWPIRLK